ncbi:hypothetical protein HDU93_004951 [Gonapodya sp. JEL0774]|nr:hypothetical protein HDU93_004951 [Gonapodya sp. JEL0774]
MTDRLVLRHLDLKDIGPLHELRTQEPVMRWTSAGRVDRDISETEQKLALFLPPNDLVTVNCAICLRDSGKFIGVGGVYRLKGDFGWPELGYMFRTEYWGKGFATEFVRAFLPYYAALPRIPARLSVSESTLVDGSAPGGGSVEELLVAVIETRNGPSHTVLKKCGFEHFLDFVDPEDSNQPPINLMGFRWVPKPDDACGKAILTHDDVSPATSRSLVLSPSARSTMPSLTHARIAVNTTLPVPPSNSERSPVVTNRLLLRALKPEDIGPLYELRTQEPVMRWTTAGRVDGDISESQERLTVSGLPPHDLVTVNCAVCLRDSGEFIGIGGVYRLKGDFGWPELGYMFRMEYWGKGFATEFVRGFLEFYAAIPRIPVEIPVSESSIAHRSVTGENSVTVEEVLVAVIDAKNIRSQGVLEKSGFKRFEEYKELDNNSSDQSYVDLIGYLWIVKRNARN